VLIHRRSPTAAQRVELLSVDSLQTRQLDAKFWRRVALWSAAFALAFVVAIVIHDALKPRTPLLRTVLGLDFQVFYCAGRVAAAGADPYRVEPLRSCEHEVEVNPGWNASEVIPAPLPGYLIGIFEALSRLSFGAAKFVWGGLLVASLVVTAFILASLTRFPLVTTFLGLAAADGFVNITDGQSPPLCIALMCVAAYQIARGLHEWAAVSMALTMIEPHIGLPGCLSMFIWLPRSRIALLLSAFALASAGVVAIGLGPTIEYVRVALPAHALAEVPASHQYSLTHVLNVLGVSETTALKFGVAAYAAMLAVGIAIARHVATALQSDEFLVLFPVAASLLGASFVHDYQIAAALPAAFLLAARADAFRPGAWTALVLLVAPAASRWAGHLIGPVAIGVIAAIAIFLLTVEALRPFDPVRRVAAGLATVTVLVLMILAIRTVPAAARTDLTGPLDLPTAVVQPEALASDNWAATIRLSNARTRPSETRHMLQKAPTWIGLGLLLVSGMAQRRPKRSESA